jgi:hypothetical protein
MALALPSPNIPGVLPLPPPRLQLLPRRLQVHRWFSSLLRPLMLPAQLLLSRAETISIGAGFLTRRAS